jgi:signal transduction histidine kinase
MSFRTRLFLAFGALVLLPLAVLLVGVRREVSRRLSSDMRERVSELVSVARADLAQQSKTLGVRLDALDRDLGSDNSLRLALRSPEDRRYLLDYARHAMVRGGLALLQIRDSTGRILSSGHFRNEYDVVEPHVVPLLAGAREGTAVLRARTPEGFIVVLARVDSVWVAGQELSTVGGFALDREFLNRLYRGPDLVVSLHLPGDSVVPSADSLLVAAFAMPFIDASATTDVRLDSARIMVAHSLAPLALLQRDVNLWFLVVALATAVAALGLAAWMASLIARPLQELARKTARVDLDRLDVDFEAEAEGEVGALSRLLAEMTRRLRVGTARLREAERRATVGDLARQLNPEIKNGLVPIRNVIGHLGQVAKQTPTQLPAVLLERQGTLAAGIEYLENLARNYARLSPELSRRPCNLNAVVAEIAQAVAATSSTSPVTLKLGEALPAVAADPLVIRRIVENLVTNAVESLKGARGQVTVSTSNGEAGSRGTVRLEVADTGRGMTNAELERAFEDFYTTKPGGTGLGLPIVRRLVHDLQGALRVETEPGSGTRFIIDLPVADSLTP